ncbi:MAG: hypothetical protein JWP57_486 [Spirosoma sp.]|nr:hypothetical protein [Spirosoma sp.]
MKTFFKPLLLSLAFSLVSLSATLADSNPGNRTKTVALFKTGIYSTAEGKLQIALEKETGGAVDVKLKNKDGKVLFSQHLGKKEKAARLRLNLSELPDGEYQVEVTNGVDVTTHNVQLSTKQPSAPSRLVAIN